DGFQADHLPPEPLQPETISADTTTAPSSDKAPAPTAVPLAILASPPSAAAILASRGQEIARLNAKLVEDTAAFANRPRRKAISASTQEYKYASYLETWRRKVEAIGNLNYPEEARRRKLYGNLILQVGVRADGSLEEVRVLRSSGSTILDEAAMRIVHLAAPFAPFPPDIRRETDFLDITRTWQFLSNNRFGGKP
ncbi:MAG: energy transducer TonB, partial [Gammaproteobacteria bacterium]|nr:energy transducer TonB [Gammaproteobacteria bacterium]